MTGTKGYDLKSIQDRIERLIDEIDINEMEQSDLDLENEEDYEEYIYLDERLAEINDELEEAYLIRDRLS